METLVSYFVDAFPVTNCPFVFLYSLPSDDSDDDRGPRKKGRQVRQAATKAVSKQREMILGEGGSEEEGGEEEEDEDDTDAYTGGEFTLLHSSLS